jgi:PIN domain nuclease of toxin-antitoxin system
MRLLLDTHVFLWCTTDSPHLSKAVRSKISSASEVYISSASIWEIAIKTSIKKLNVNIDQIVAGIITSGFLELPITIAHAMAVYNLSALHRDPFDRLLIAQAIAEPLTFLTADKQLRGYSNLVEVITSA